MPKLDELSVDLSVKPDVQAALRAAADAFAEALGVGGGPSNDWSSEISVSATEARALANLAEAWSLIADAIDTAFMEEGRAHPDCEAVKWKVKDHIQELQDVVTDMAGRRRAWMTRRLEKYRPH